MRILHCSDVHITADYGSIPFFQLGWRRWIALGELKFGGRARQYEGAGKTLARIVERFATEKANHLILSGDVTAYALESEFREARQALGALGENKAKCTVIPGNHDVYTPQASTLFERHFGHLLESDLPEYCREGPFPFVRLLDQIAVVGLGSARVPKFPGLSYGYIGAAQLSGVRQLLSDPRLKGRAVLAVVHHAPLLKNGRPDKPHHRLWDASALLEQLPGGRFGVLHGHVHQRYHHPATEHRPHIFGAGSSTQKGNEGYWLIDVEDGRIAQAEKRTLEVADYARSGAPV